MTEKRFVKRIKKVKGEVELQQKFDAKLPPTQCYQQEKDLVLMAVKLNGYKSISDFTRMAVRAQLETLGFEVPEESKFVTVEPLAEL